MSDNSLVVRFADLDAMEAALRTAHANIVDQIAQARREAAQQMTAWAADTPSRRAQLAYDVKLENAVAELTASLESVRLALAKARLSAHETEVRNVAIMD